MEKNILTSINKNNASIKQNDDKMLAKEEKENYINNSNNTKINNFLDSELLSTIQNFINANKENKEKEKEKKINDELNKQFFSSQRLKTEGNQIDVQKLVSVSRQFRTERRNAIQQKIGQNIITPNELQVVNSLLLNPNERNVEDLHKIAFFISGCSLINGLLYNAQKRQKDIEKLVYDISFRIKYKFIPKDSILFRIGDIPDNFYTIVQGKVEILKPKKYVEEKNCLEYLNILVDYERKEEFYLLNETINLNIHLFEIRKRDLNEIKLSMIKNLLDEYFKNSWMIKGEKIINIIKDYNYENEILGNIGIDNDMILDLRNHNNIKKLKKLKEEIYKFLPEVFSPKMKKILQIINDKEDIRKVSLLKYSQIVELKDKDFFGDTAFDTKSNRNATVHALEDTHLCYLEKEHYDLLLRVDKKSQRLSSLHFLYDNFFLKHLSQDIFANLFFNNFIYEEKPKNAILFEQYNPSNFLYLIRYGEIELSNKSSIVQVYYLTKYLSQLNLEDNIKEYIGKVKNFDTSKLAPVVKNDFYFMKKDLTKKKDYFLFNVLSKDLIGLESLVFDMPYLYTAKVISKSAFLYKIEKSVLFQLIKNYDNILNHMGKDGKQKMKLILERFIEINRFQIKMVDKNISKKIVYHNLRLNEIKENKKIQKAMNILMSQNNKIKTNENEKKLENNKKCLSENSRMSLDIFGENYSIFNIKNNNSYKTLIRLSEKNKNNYNNNYNFNNIYHNEKLRNLKIINFNQNDNVHLKPEKHLLLDKIRNNEKKEDKKVNNFFFTQPINKSRNYMSKIDKEFSNNDNHKLLKTKFDKNNLLFKVDNNFISLNVYNDRNKEINIQCPKANKMFSNYNNNVPYILKTIVNIEKIKSLKFNPKGLSSSKKDIKKKIRLVNVLKKSFSFNRKSIIGSQ